MDVPSDPFLRDADGCSKSCRDLIARVHSWTTDYGPAVYWAARWAAHWAQRSDAWAARYGRATQADRVIEARADAFFQRNSDLVRQLRDT